MGILDRARADARRILSNLNGWATALHFENPANDQQADINGTFFRRTVLINDQEGTPVNTRMAHITFAEADFTPDYYEIRNAAGVVHMEGHLVSCMDSTGTLSTYIIREWHPDETLGIIRCMLGDYQG